MEPQLRAPVDATTPVRVGWEVLHLLLISVRSLEDTATRIVAAQVAGLIALWTQLNTFEDGPPEVLVWAAWAVLVGSILVLGIVVTPRRVTRFWTSLSTKSLLIRRSVLEEADELEMIDDLGASLRLQRDSLHRTLRLSIALGLVALGLASIAYVVERAFYAP